MIQGNFKNLYNRFENGKRLEYKDKDLTLVRGVEEDNTVLTLKHNGEVILKVYKGEVTPKFQILLTMDQELQDFYEGVLEILHGDYIELYDSILLYKHPITILNMYRYPLQPLNQYEREYLLKLMAGVIFIETRYKKGICASGSCENYLKALDMLRQILIEVYGIRKVDCIMRDIRNRTLS